MGIILFIISQVLKIILFPAGFITAVIKSVYKQKFFKEGLPTINKKFLAMATSLDVHGAVVCSELFNMTLRKEQGHTFGTDGLTISECLGVNQLNGTLTKTGKILVSILNLIQKDHCLKALGYTDEQIKQLKGLKHD